MQALQVPLTEAIAIARTDTDFSERLEHCQAATPVSLSDEAEALLGVEPLHSSLCHAG